MSKSAAQQPPVIPPRPFRNQEKTNMPPIPPRPSNRRLERSTSPNHDRFALSPLNESPFASKPPLGCPNLSKEANIGDSTDRSKSVDLPSVGEEGKEYGYVAEEANRAVDSSPGHTRTIANDLKLHAPKPSLPATSANQRVMAVTRTDSDKAASFGIGRPSSGDEGAGPTFPGRILKRKASTTSQLSYSSSHFDDEQGIPEIGKRVPMFPNAGDVQAPSPAPGSNVGDKAKSHVSRSSDFNPPGSYGLHGNGVVSQHKLERAYYEKHPDLLQKERKLHHHDRPNDYSRSREDLDKIVRETANRSSGLGTPSEQIGWQAIEESASRVASPHLASMASVDSLLKSAFCTDATPPEDHSPEEGDVIHVDMPNSGHRRSALFSGVGTDNSDGEEHSTYNAPILAEDEIAKHPSSYDHQPAVELPLEHLEGEHSRGGSVSHTTSRPASLMKEISFEVRSTRLEDVDEYEPLFPDDDKPVEHRQPVNTSPKPERRFPSRDIWEDAPNSVHCTAEVSTPDIQEPKERVASFSPPHENETPAQAFARHQEELAEKEDLDRTLNLEHEKPKANWVQPQLPLSSEVKSRPSMANRFPSRDVWEDTPDCLRLETTVSTPQQDPDIFSPSEMKPEIPRYHQGKFNEASFAFEDAAKSAITGRPKPQQLSGEDKKFGTAERAKPPIPARPLKAGAISGGLETSEAVAPPRQRPAVPARPTGPKIAALQAGFLSDLNNRLRQGPQATKKEEAPVTDEAQAEQKEKGPLSDARKGRARGPQRRAPAKVPVPATAESSAKQQLTLSLVRPHTFFEIDPADGSVAGDGDASKPSNDDAAMERSTEPSPTEEALKAESVQAEVGNEELMNMEVEQALEAGNLLEKAGKEEPADAEADNEEPELPAEKVAGEAPKPQPVQVEVKSLATNLAGEPVTEVTPKEDKFKRKVEPVRVAEF